MCLTLIYNILNYFAEEAAQKRKERFEKFNKPPPLAALKGGRMTRRQEQIIKDEKKQQRKKRKNGKFNQIRKKVIKKPVKSENVDNESKPQLPQENPKVGEGNVKADVSVESQQQQQPPPKKKRRVIERLVHPNVSRNRRSNAAYGFATPESSTKNEVHNIVQLIMDEMLNRVEKAAIVLDEAEKMNLDVNSAKEEVVKRRLSVESLEPSKEETNPIIENGSDVTPLEEVIKAEPSKETNGTEKVENVKEALEVDKVGEEAASQIQPKKPAKKKKPSIIDIINRLKSKEVERTVQPSEEKEIISESVEEPKVEKIEVVESPRKRRRNTLPAPVNGIIIEGNEHAKENGSKSQVLKENVQSPKSTPQKRRRNTTIVVDTKIETTEAQVEIESPSKEGKKRSPRKKNKIVEIEPSLAVIANDDANAKPDASSIEKSEEEVKEIPEENIPTMTPKKRLRTPIKKKDDHVPENLNVEVENAKSESANSDVKSRRTPRKSTHDKVDTSDNHIDEALLIKTSQRTTKSKRTRVKKKAKSKTKTSPVQENGTIEPDLVQLPPEVLPIVQEPIAKSDAKRTTPRKAKPPIEDLSKHDSNQETLFGNDTAADDDAQIKEVLEEILNRRASIESNTSLSVSDQNDPPEQIVDIVKPEPEQPLPNINSKPLDDVKEGPDEFLIQPCEVVEDEIVENGVVDNAQPSEVKKRRSSFAASFYSQPLRDRSLRRSNGRINYVEDLDEVIKVEEDLNTSIRRKKRPNNASEGGSVKKRSKSTSSSSSEVAEKSVKSSDKKKSNRKSKINLVNGGSNSSLSKVNQQENKDDAFDNLFNGVTNEFPTKKENTSVEESKTMEDRPRRNANSSFSYLEEFADEDDNSLLGYENESVEISAVKKDSVDKKKSKKKSKEPSEAVTKKHKKKKKKKRASKKDKLETATEDEEEELVRKGSKKAKLMEKVQDENRQNDNNTSEPLTHGQDVDHQKSTKNESIPQDMPIRRQHVNNEDVSSTDDERPRRHLNNNLMLDASVSARVVFPLEVKACAIQRIKDGATKVQVARDLGAPLSTVSSWWHRRSSIVPDATPEDTNSDSASVSSAADHELTGNACMLIANSTTH